MSDLLLQAIHRIPEGSVILIRQTHPDSGEYGGAQRLRKDIAEKVGHDKFLLVFLGEEETWRVESARLVHEQLTRFLARVDDVVPLSP